MIRRILAHGGRGGKGRTAFVLSGGGSLGALQVGMLQALTDAGIRPDFLMGTSVGAVNAAWMAGSPDHDGARKLGEIWMGLRRQTIFPLSPWSSALGLLGRCNHVISNSNLRVLLERHLPFQRLEETAVPVHVVTTELKTGRAVLMSSGPAVPALLASTAIPGIFPPVTIGRREFIDGGVANHTPIAAAIELGATRIFVLPVGYPWLRQEPTNALGMALHALARFVEQKLDAEVAAYKKLADIQVLPTLEAPAVSPADFSHTEELMTRGYRAARKYLGSLSQAAEPAKTLKLAAAVRAAQGSAENPRREIRRSRGRLPRLRRGDPSGKQRAAERAHPSIRKRAAQELNAEMYRTGAEDPSTAFPAEPIAIRRARAAASGWHANRPPPETHPAAASSATAGVSGG